MTIKPLSAIRKDENLIILAEEENQLPAGYFNDAERKYIRQEFKSSRNLITVNQYGRMIWIQVLSGKDLSESRRLENARKAGAALYNKIKDLKPDSIAIRSFTDPAGSLAFTEGLSLAAYTFTRYKSGKKKDDYSLGLVGLMSDGISEKETRQLEILVNAVWKTRDLVNEPQSFLTATELSKQFVKLGKEAGFRVTVFNKAKIRELKMGGLLAVNQGSLQPPTFTVMEYKPTGAVNKKPVVLVGKGVVYDTGGMSLKPTVNSMDFMKCDMAGGAVVGGTMYAIAKSKLPLHVIGIVPATDNRPDGDAYVPGDVITMMSGKTVEVLNTDAEGRLILADALHYAKKFNPSLVMEFSTLTGAAAAAVGQYGIVTMGTAEEDTKNALSAAGENAYERLAWFPFWDEFDELLKSDIADFKNIGGPVAGAITAGRFLVKFTDYPYVHFDIAGPAWSKSNDSYRGKNGTGTGVRMLMSYFRNIADGTKTKAVSKKNERTRK